jgi:nucleotide-binding universal stress UspA family protein
MRDGSSKASLLSATGRKGQAMATRILVPLDGTRSGEQALPVAVNLARGSGATLHLVRIHVRPERAPLSLEGMPVIDKEADDRCRAAESAYLARIGERLARRSELSARIEVLDGPVDEVLAAYASSHAIDLIVMATHGRRGIARACLGSVADAVLRASRLPVLAEGARPRILIALDGSTLSESVVEPALALGRPLDATYALLRVVNPVAVWGDMSAALAPEMAQAAAARREAEARDYLSAIGWWMQERGLDVETSVVASEHPAEAILQESARMGAAFIAMATHGRHGISRLVMGSVAAGVLPRARVPLLLYRPRMETRGLGLQTAMAGAVG